MFLWPLGEAPAAAATNPVPQRPKPLLVGSFHSEQQTNKHIMYINSVVTTTFEFVFFI